MKKIRSRKRGRPAFKKTPALKCLVAVRFDEPTYQWLLAEAERTDTTPGIYLRQMAWDAHMEHIKGE